MILVMNKGDVMRGVGGEGVVGVGLFVEGGEVVEEGSLVGVVVGVGFGESGGRWGVWKERGLVCGGRW